MLYYIAEHLIRFRKMIFFSFRSVIVFFCPVEMGPFFLSTYERTGSHEMCTTFRSRGSYWFYEDAFLKSEQLNIVR